MAACCEESQCTMVTMTALSRDAVARAESEAPPRIGATRHWSPFGRSPLKRQIRLLGILGLAAVLACLALAVALVRQSESARVADAAAHLAQAASQMAERYDY